MPLTERHRLSFEFFPPKTEKGIQKLASVAQVLGGLQHEFFSVTYGAGGSTRDNTKKVVLDTLKAGFDVAPHLSFGGDEEGDIRQLIQDYLDAGVKRIVALRGDLPSGFGDGSRMAHANELVGFIRKEFGEQIILEVAAYPEIHPESKSYESDIYYLKKKFDAGANSAITQYFFNVDAYRYFVDGCQAQGIDKPIYPGIMPIINFRNLQRFSANCGAEIPRWFTKKIESYEKPEDAVKFAADFVTGFCEQLLESGAPGLHFYTMNQTEPVLGICKNLGVSRR